MVKVFSSLSHIHTHNGPPLLPPPHNGKKILKYVNALHQRNAMLPPPPAVVPQEIRSVSWQR